MSTVDDGGRPPLPAFGVLLTNLGSPAAPTTGAVRSYLREFLADRRVVDLPRLRWWLIRNLFILPLRPRRSAANYRTIWTEAGSPLTVTTRRIGDALSERLNGSGGPGVPLAVAMRYGSPSIADGLAALTERGCTRILVLPLYPQYSTTTTASASDAVAAAVSGMTTVPDLRTVHDYHDHPAYLTALQSVVRKLWDENGPPNRLIMSFHGIPRRYADLGDPYPKQCAATTRTLAARLELAPGRWHMAYQSRFGKEPWLLPELDARLTRWGQRGVSGVDVMCPGFAADCLETLEEVAVRSRERFTAAGGSGFRYLPALNDRSEHITALTEIVADNTVDWASRQD
jgi:protoporphyrin/coproporphyrin ferrochelatase